MAIHIYQCESCSKVVEFRTRGGTPPPSTCPQCTGKLVLRPAKTSFVLKGGGWAANNYGG